MDFPIKALGELAVILKDNGVYAVVATFIIFWAYERWQNQKNSRSQTEVMMQKLKNDIQIERTLQELSKVLEKLGDKIDKMNHDMTLCRSRFSALIKKRKEIKAQKKQQEAEDEKR